MTAYGQRTFLILAFMLTVLISGCATPISEPARTGFLSDYSKLEKVDSKQWLYSGGYSTAYQTFHIAPIATLYQDSGEDPMFTVDEIEELKQHIRDTLSQRLSENGGYTVVDQPQAGTASFKIAITDLDASNGFLNAAIYTKVTGAGLGGLALEGELVDADTGEQLAAAIRWGTGSRVLRAGFTRLGDAKILVNRWAKDVRSRFDAANSQ